MAKFEWSEVFISIEGEGMYSGHPTAYIRFAKCNFQCRGFNNPENLDTTDIAVLGFDPKNYTKLTDIPLITHGCDSIYSWDPKFAHMWRTGDEHVLAQEVLSILPNNSFAPTSGSPTILSLTGGEPTLRAKFIPALLNTPEFAEVSHVLVETNCAVPLKREFIMFVSQWLSADPTRKWTWSNSPKLSVSGEAWADAIRPDIATMQRMVVGDGIGQRMTQYFKFVCDDTDASFDEVAAAMEEYYAAGVPRSVGVYIMPVACQQQDQTNIASAVASKCIQRNYIYCHRVHLDVFGNTVGT